MGSKTRTPYTPALATWWNDICLPHKCYPCRQGHGVRMLAWQRETAYAPIWPWACHAPVCTQCTHSTLGLLHSCLHTMHPFDPGPVVPPSAHSATFTVCEHCRSHIDPASTHFPPCPLPVKATTAQGPTCAIQGLYAVSAGDAIRRGRTTGQQFFFVLHIAI